MKTCSPTMTILEQPLDSETIREARLRASSAHGRRATQPDRLKITLAANDAGLPHSLTRNVAQEPCRVRRIRPGRMVGRVGPGTFKARRFRRLRPRATECG